MSNTADRSNFCVAGINYKKTDSATRGSFAISQEQYANILNTAPSYGVDSLFILSTCNRTEIYGFADEPETLVNLLCSQTAGLATDFKNFAYIKKGADAIQHLFRVGAGLDSQILGDYEIVGQLKQAVKFAKERGFVNAFTERLFNMVLQASKEIKNETSLSGGTVSVSFAAVQYIKENIANYTDKEILLIGTGKIGRNTCKNLVDYLGTRRITLINRSEDKAAQLGKELGLRHAPLSELEKNVSEADIILVATNADEPTILKRYVEGYSKKLIIDLSVPNNAEPAVAELSNVTLVNVDQLSKMKDETLKMREAEIPHALQIINGHYDTFIGWCQMRKNAAVLGSIKEMLNQIAAAHQREFNNPHTRCPYIAAEQKIQQVVNGIASRMRSQNDQPGCHYLQAIVEFIETNHR